MSPPSLLVTGLNSQPGWFLANTLARHPAPVTVLGRQRPADLPASLTWRSVDLQSPTHELPSARVLLHLAPIWLLPPLLAALPASSVPETIIAISSSSARTKAQARNPRERTLARRLADAENAAQAYAARHRLACRILRPTLIYGHPSRGIVPRVRHLGRRLRLFPVPTGATGLRQPVHAADLAMAAWRLAAAADHSNAPASPQDIGGGERLAFATMLRRILHDAVPAIRPLPVPGALLRCALAIAPGDVGPGMLDRLRQDQVADDAALWHELGIVPRRFQP